MREGGERREREIQHRERREEVGRGREREIQHRERREEVGGEQEAATHSTTQNLAQRMLTETGKR